MVLQSGSHLPMDRWEKSGDQILIYREGGVLTLAAADVVEFLEETDAPQPVAVVVAIAEAAAKPVVLQTDPKLVIAEMAEQYGLPAKFVSSVARAESAYRMDAVSPKGAIGVMQLMPGTSGWWNKCSRLRTFRYATPQPRKTPNTDICFMAKNQMCTA